MAEQAHRARKITPIKLGGVWAYLIEVQDGFVLIDTGTPEKRERLIEQLAAAGCVPGTLRLVLLTHGDYDHAGNAAYLRDTHVTKIAMHREDVIRTSTGDWNRNLKAEPDHFSPLFRLVSKLIRPGLFDAFTPDFTVGDGESLASHGLDATVIDLPGHTWGSIGILLPDGTLFCGDLMDGIWRPGLEFFINDLDAARASLRRLSTLDVGLVYPGHGKPFDFERVNATRW